MSLIWGVWFGFGVSGGETKEPIPQGSAVLAADLYGGLMWAHTLTIQVSLYPNIQTAGTCLDNWIRGKASLLLGNHEVGIMASPLCILNTGTYTVYRGNYTEEYEYRTGARTYGVGGFYNIRLTFIRTVRAYVGVDFLYPVIPETVPLKEGDSPAPHVSYPTVGVHVGWTWGRRLIP
jgi:hypothetical protein